MTTALVVLGGALGAVTRYLVDHTARHRYDDEKPLGVLVVNIVGSLLAGLALGSLVTDRLSEAAARVLLIGVLGGFTTFSTVVVDTFVLAETSRRAATAYLGASVVGGVGAAALGMGLSGAL